MFHVICACVAGGELCRHACAQRRDVSKVLNDMLELTYAGTNLPLQTLLSY